MTWNAYRDRYGEGPEDHVQDYPEPDTRCAACDELHHELHTRKDRYSGDQVCDACWPDWCARELTNPDLTPAERAYYLLGVRPNHLQPLTA